MYSKPFSSIILILNFQKDGNFHLKGGVLTDFLCWQKLTWRVQLDEHRTCVFNASSLSLIWKPTEHLTNVYPQMIQHRNGRHTLSSFWYYHWYAMLSFLFDFSFCSNINYIYQLQKLFRVSETDKSVRKRKKKSKSWWTV